MVLWLLTGCLLWNHSVQPYSQATVLHWCQRIKLFSLCVISGCLPPVWRTRTPPQLFLEIAREKLQLLSWKCPSLLRSKSCLVSLIPAPQQQQPQQLLAPPSPCGDVEPELPPSRFPTAYHSKGWEMAGLCYCRFGKGMPGSLRAGIQVCHYGKVEGGWPQPHPWHRLLWNAARARLSPWDALLVFTARQAPIHCCSAASRRRKQDFCLKKHKVKPTKALYQPAVDI